MGAVVIGGIRHGPTRAAGTSPVRTGGPDDSGDGGPGRMRILVVSADIGAGHDAAAAELADRLTDDRIVVEHLNVITALPRPLHPLVRDGYRTMLRWIPWSYDALFTITDRSSLAVTAIRAALRTAIPRMLSRIPPDIRLVVTTFPFANQILGPMRRAGQLTAPVLAYVTDYVMHPVWMAPGIDTYCVIHDATQQQATVRGASDVRVVNPLISDRFTAMSAAGRRAARAHFGLPARERLALIVAGSWGVGDVARTAREVLAAGCVTPVVVCGRNDDLRRRLDAFPGHVMGWVDDMPTLMPAVDIVIENAGGLTCQQSLACGLPTITYRPIPGHGRANARVLAEAGLTTYAATSTQLASVLSALAAAEETVTTPSVTAADMATVISDAVRTDHRPRTGTRPGANATHRPSLE